jgi:hypothetical protein
MPLTKGAKQELKNFNAAVARRRQYIINLLAKYSKVYKKNGIVYPDRLKAINAAHHNVMNNLRKPRSKNWRKVKGRWECNGCALKVR